MKIIVRIGITLFCVMSAMTIIRAQIPAAFLQCVTNTSQGVDSISYDIPAVSCGPITQIIVFQSPSQEGPYQPIDTITDLSILSLEVANPTNRTNFYYLLLEASCGVLNSTPSDTISNQQPPAIPIISASVTSNDAVILRWNDLSRTIKKIAGYVIYRVDIGTIPIDTIFGSFEANNWIGEYTDNNASPSNSAVFYYVQAIDQCGVLGPIGNNPYNTIHLTSELLPCQRAIKLNWVPNMAWDTVVDEYQVWVGEDGMPPVQVGETSVDSFSVPGIDASRIYTVYIRAKLQDTAIFAASNWLEINPQGNIIQGITSLQLWGADVTETGVDLSWNWNEDAQIRMASIRSNLDDFASAVATLDLNNIMAQNVLSLTEDASAGPRSFFIEGVDECDSTFQSDTVRTAYISGLIAPDLSTQLTIIYPVVSQNVTLSRCEIIKYSDGQEVERISLDMDQQQFTDATSAETQTYCYQLVCTGFVSLPGGNQQSLTLRSNISCPTREVRVHFPNAFRPEGRNSVFRPLFLFEESITSYEFSIFNRYGEMIFQTDNPALGWNGSNNAGAAPAGAYVYQMSLTQADGRTISRQGTFILLR